MTGNLATTLAGRARANGWLDRPAFHSVSPAGIVTHGEVHAAAARAAGVLATAGVRTGDRVLIALPDSIGLVAAFLGALRLGAIAVFAGPWQSAPEHAQIVADAEPVAVVCEPELAPRFGTAAVDLATEPAVMPELVVHSGDVPAYVQYTSGTTGSPKGAVHRHADPIACCRAMAGEALRMTPGDVVFSVSKACFPYGLGNTVLFPLYTGASAILWPDRPSMPGIVEVTRRHRPTLLFTAPPHYAKLVAAGDASAFASLRAAGSAGETLSPALADRVEEFLGCPLLDGLGMTETAHTFISNTVDRRRRGSVGVVLDPYEISVRASVLYVRGPSVLMEYYGRPDRTAEVLDPDGWLRTGDVVHVDTDGFVYHHGRADDVETVDGVPVSPQPVELALGGHPAVAEVAAAVVDGEVRAFVVPQPGHNGSAAELRELAGSRLRIPVTVSFVPDLPRTANGKLHRIRLHEEAKG